MSYKVRDEATFKAHFAGQDDKILITNLHVNKISKDQVPGRAGWDAATLVINIE